MKLSISNIAWDTKYNDEVYAYLNKKNFKGLEIAPTKLFPEKPYDHIEDAVDYCKKINDKYGLEICSMQSIWYGMTGNIFESDESRETLQNYTYKAIDFASAIGCKNLVFGNPKARNKGKSLAANEVIKFFENISSYAVSKETVVSLEPNPVIYNTDFINYTAEAFDYCKKIKGLGLKVNVDLGTIIYNKESLDDVKDNINLVNHIHISEPYLAIIEKRKLHKELYKLSDIGYDKYFSIEMGNRENISDVYSVIDYVRDIFID